MGRAGGWLWLWLWPLLLAACDDSQPGTVISRPGTRVVGATPTGEMPQLLAQSMPGSGGSLATCPVDHAVSCSTFCCASGQRCGSDGRCWGDSLGATRADGVAAHCDASQPKLCGGWCCSASATCGAGGCGCPDGANLCNGECCGSESLCAAPVGKPTQCLACSGDFPEVCVVDSRQFGGQGNTCCRKDAPCVGNGECSCPPDLPVTCGSGQSDCCPAGTFCTSKLSNNNLDCAGCDSGETPCGNLGDQSLSGGYSSGGACCLPGIQCVDKQCKCPGDKPVVCNGFCCPAGMSCATNNRCTPTKTCTSTNGSCTSNGDCCTGHCTSNLPGIPGNCY